MKGCSLEHYNAQDGVFLERGPIERVQRVCCGLRMELDTISQDAMVVGCLNVWLLWARLLFGPVQRRTLRSKLFIHRLCHIVLFTIEQEGKEKQNAANDAKAVKDQDPQPEEMKASSKANTIVIIAEYRAQVEKRPDRMGFAWQMHDKADVVQQG